jgi:hypothetical protein
MAKKAITLLLFFALLAPGCASSGSAAARNRQANSWAKSVEDYREQDTTTTNRKATAKYSNGTSAGEVAGNVALGTAYIAGAIALDVFLGLLGG